LSGSRPGRLSRNIRYIPNLFEFAGLSVAGMTVCDNRAVLTQVTFPLRARDVEIFAGGSGRANA
jgi:hypothetical protein